MSMFSRIKCEGMVSAEEKAVQYGLGLAMKA